MQRTSSSFQRMQHQVYLIALPLMSLCVWLIYLIGRIRQPSPFNDTVLPILGALLAIAAVLSLNKRLSLALQHESKLPLQSVVDRAVNMHIQLVQNFIKLRSNALLGDQELERYLDICGVYETQYLVVSGNYSLQTFRTCPGKHRPESRSQCRMIR